MRLWQLLLLLLTDLLVVLLVLVVEWSTTTTAVSCRVDNGRKVRRGGGRDPKHSTEQHRSFYTLFSFSGAVYQSSRPHALTVTVCLFVDALTAAGELVSSLLFLLLLNQIFSVVVAIVRLHLLL